MSAATPEEYLGNCRIILASGSARRNDILTDHGFPPEVMPMDVDETLPADISPRDAVMYLALKKGLAALDKLAEARHDAFDDHNNKDAGCDPAAKAATLIISADTVVAAKDITNTSEEFPGGRPSIFGKPKDEKDAYRMLSSIRGHEHEVITGVSLIGFTRTSDSPEAARLKSAFPYDPSDPSGMTILFKRVFFDATKVFAGEMSDEELSDYIASGEPFGKAGGYAIQLGFDKFIDHIEGDYENVVGFPYEHMISELSKLSNFK